MSTENKCTPAPWIVHTSASAKGLTFNIHGTASIIDGERKYEQVAEVYLPDSFKGEANANLIAAAPDLLEAMEALIDHVKYHSIPMGSGMWMKLKSAVAKARK